MNEKYLEMAQEKVRDVHILINSAAKRAAELSRGARALVPTRPDDKRSHLDLAMLEIAEGKITVSYEEDGTQAQA